MKDTYQIYGNAASHEPRTLKTFRGHQHEFTRWRKPKLQVFFGIRSHDSCQLGNVLRSVILHQRREPEIGTNAKLIQRDAVGSNYASQLREAFENSIIKRT